jgi:hypothetical protein
MTEMRAFWRRAILSALPLALVLSSGLPAFADGWRLLGRHRARPKV